MELYRVKQNDKEMVWFLQNRFGGNSQKVEQYIHPQACIYTDWGTGGSLVHFLQFPNQTHKLIQIISDSTKSSGLT